MNTCMLQCCGVLHFAFTVRINDYYKKTYFTLEIIISPNEVFGDIMVLASPPVDPDDVNALNSKNIQWISFKVYMRVDTPLRYVAIEI